MPPIVATLATYAAFALLTANVFREHYLTPLVAYWSNLHFRIGMDPERVVDERREARLRKPNPARLDPAAVSFVVRCDWPWCGITVFGLPLTATQC